MMEPEAIGAPAEVLVTEPAAVPKNETFPRLCVWIGLVVAFAAFLLVVQLPTHLGIKAPSYDKSGREYVWRIWWYPRHHFVSFGPNWLVDILLFGLLGCILAASLAALWIALVPEDTVNGSESPARP